MTASAVLSTAPTSLRRVSAECPTPRSELDFAKLTKSPQRPRTEGAGVSPSDVRGHRGTRTFKTLCRVTELTGAASGVQTLADRVHQLPLNPPAVLCLNNT